MIYDYIIAGGGTTGCVLAGLLSEKYKVLLIEKGANSEIYNLITRFPIANYFTLRSKIFTKNYLCEPSQNLNYRKIDWPRGEYLGGSSTINGLLYKRGHQSDFEYLYDKNLITFKWDQIEKFYNIIENKLGIKINDHYQNNTQIKNTIVDYFLESCQDNGYKLINSLNDLENNFESVVAKYDLTIRNSKRAYSSNTFLKKNKNLKILCNTLVSKIAFENNNATGVEIIKKNGKKEIIPCGKEVILSAGTINSPKILQLSGIGNKKILESKNIKTIFNNPKVGENLRDHLQTKLTYEINSINNYNHINRNLWNKLKELYKYFIHDTGMFKDGIIRAGAFTGTSQNEEKYNFQINLLLGSGKNLDSVDKFDGISISVNTLNPQSSGFISIRSNNPKDDPLIYPNYFDHPEDLNKHIKGIKFIRKIANTKPLSDIILNEKIPGKSINSEDEIIDFIKDTSSTIYHPTGTCRLGNNDDGVVDKKFNLVGVKNVRVCDASVLPKSINGNPMATCYLLGYMLNDLIVNK
jgi:choline dehydrogenase